MNKHYYLIEVEGGVESIVYGPYRNRDEQDNAAKQIHRIQEEDDGLFWAEIDEAGVLTVESYAAAFFLEDSTEDASQG